LVKCESGMESAHREAREMLENQYEELRWALTEDEIAIAESLVRMGEHVQGGPSFYSLVEGSQDQYLALLLEQAVNTEKAATSESQPWSAQ
jgi:flagellar hook-length control protein FliK